MLTVRGVTWIEVVVVLVVIVLLVAVFVPSVGHGGPSNRSYCATNLKGMGASLSIYGAKFNDSLPVVAGSTAMQWLCDEPATFATWVAADPASVPPANQVHKELYCPSNSSQDPSTMANWGGMSVMGYAFFNYRGPEATEMPQDFPTRVPPLEYRRTIASAKYATDTVLALDVIISEAPGATATNFTRITRPGNPQLTFSTSHLAADKPAGANVLFLDGHVSWRPFIPSKASAIKQGGKATAYFWVPNW